MLGNLLVLGTIKNVNRYNRIGYYFGITQQAICLTIDPVVVNSYFSTVDVKWRVTFCTLWRSRFTSYPKLKGIWCYALCMALRRVFIMWSICDVDDLDRHYPIMKTRLFQYIEHFTTNYWKFSNIKFSYISYFCSNMDCGYSLEPPMFWAKKRKNNKYPCNPPFYSIKVGFKGVKIIQGCFRDVLRSSFLPLIKA